MRFKLTIEYDGGPFGGWQRQDNGSSVQAALGHVPHQLDENVSIVSPVLTNQPLPGLRPAMSSRPSPLKSPTTTSLQVVLGHWFTLHHELENVPVALPALTNQLWPGLRPAMSSRPSLSKSPTTTSLHTVLAHRPPVHQELVNELAALPALTYQ